jgi:4-hydroxybenzoate polyprenyltransferase
MYITKIYLVEALLTGSFLIENLADIYEVPVNYELNFFLLVLMMVFLAAGGNIINDYFDVRADRINKPNKTYIDYHIGRKWAIISHFTFTGLAVLIGLYLYFVLDNYWFVFFALFIAGALWFYSLILKKIFIVGNLLVAILTGLVPFIAYLYFTPLLTQYETTSLDYTMGAITFKLVPSADTIAIVSVLCVFAFLTNLIREIIKDISDILGDVRVGCKTVPIVLGVFTTKVILALLILLTASIFSIPFVMWPLSISVPVIAYPAITIIVLLLITLVLLIMANEKSKYKYASFTLKLVMLVGLLWPVILNSGTNDF